MVNLNIKGRMIWLDALKGFLMTVVVWSHSTAYNDRIGHWLIVSYMGIFFFISGFTMHYNNDSIADVIIRRAKRLLIPYLFYGILLIILDLIIRGGNPLVKFAGLLYDRYCLYRFESENNIFFLQSWNATFWFLAAMFGASVVAIIFFKYFKKFGGIPFVFVCLIITGILSSFRLLLPWSIDSIFLLAAIIIIGNHLGNTILPMEATVNKCEIFILVFSITQYMLLAERQGTTNLSLGQYGSGYESIFYYCLICILGGIVGIFLFYKMRNIYFLIKPLAWIGQRSITFLCLQLFFLWIGQLICSKLPLSTLFQNITTFIIGMCGCACIAWINQFLGKKINFFRYL